MIVDIFSDPICPWCFIGKKRLAQALDLRPDAPVTVRWRAFQLNPDMPPAGMDRQAYLSAKFGGADRAGQIYDRIRQVGETVGIDFAFDKITQTPNTVQAHRLIRFAQRPGIDKADLVTDLLFDAYFLNGERIGSIEDLMVIGERAGIDREALAAYFETDEDADEILAEDSHARRLGIGGVPCFIVDGKYALSGAQEAESFLPLFDMAQQEAEKEPATQA